MNKTILACLAITFSFLVIAPALQATCALCEKIREHNKENPSSGYTYYEDYLKAQEGKEKAEPNKAVPQEKKAEAPQKQ